MVYERSFPGTDGIGEDHAPVPSPSLFARQKTTAFVILRNLQKHTRRIAEAETKMVSVVVATGVNYDGYREILGVDIFAGEDYEKFTVPFSCVITGQFPPLCQSESWG